MELKWRSCCAYNSFINLRQRVVFFQDQFEMLHLAVLDAHKTGQTAIQKSRVKSVDKNTKAEAEFKVKLLHALQLTLTVYNLFSIILLDNPMMIRFSSEASSLNCIILRIVR